MNLALLILAVAGLYFTLAATRRLRRARARWPWWLATVVLTVGGIVAGYFVATHTWQLSPTLRIVGFPLPLGAVALEDGRWVDYVHTTVVTILFFAADILTVMFTLLLPLMLVAHRLHRPR